MRDGHISVLPLSVANKIAAGEVVDRPANVVKELVENSIDSGASRIAIAITQGGRKLISVQDDGCGMSHDDAVLSFERQATSKISSVEDIERIDTLGFRGEAIPSIASVSRFTMTTRRPEEDEGTCIQVNAGIMASVKSAGCPSGTKIEVRDLFCNVPARKKFLRTYATEEAHVKGTFTVHAIAYPNIGFSLTSDMRETYRLAPAKGLADRILDIFGTEYLERMSTLCYGDRIKITGMIEKPNLSTATRREQYVFVNGRPATSPSIAYALREGYPKRQDDARPAAIIFITLPPEDVDVNVHPTKREVRFKNNAAVKQAIMEAIAQTLRHNRFESVGGSSPKATPENPFRNIVLPQPTTDLPTPTMTLPTTTPAPRMTPPTPTPAPVQVEFATEPDSTTAKPWVWFKFLATTDSGYLLIETESGVVTVNPHAARERIAYEALTRTTDKVTAQTLLIPETVHLTPSEFARLNASIDIVRQMGFGLEPFGTDTFKIDEVPQLIGSLPPAAILGTIARDLAEGPGRRNSERWKEELIAKSIARSFAGTKIMLDEDSANHLIEELTRCRMPYVCPRGKPIMIFTSTRELNRKFARE